MQYKEGQEMKELPNCVACGKKVPDNFLVLGSPNGEDYPCCSQECVDKYHKGITGRKPVWTKIKIRK